MYQYQCLKPHKQQRLQPELILDASINPLHWYKGMSAEYVRAANPYRHPEGNRA